MPTRNKDTRTLRRKAEKRLSEAPEKSAFTPGMDPQKLIHELSVHEIELEMQNEELRRSQETLEESRNEYAELYDFSPVGYLTLDKKGLVTRANLTACSLLGIKWSLLLEKPFSGFVLPEFDGVFYLHKQKVLETTITQTCELALKRKDGTSFDALLESIAVKADGTIRTVLADVTDRKKAEGALRINQSRLETVFAAIPDALVEYDANGALVRANKSALEAARRNSLSLARDQVAANLQFANPDGSAVTIEDLPTSRALRGETVVGELYSIRTADGIDRIISTYAAPLYENGKVDGAVALWHDITETKRAEDVLRRYELLSHNSRDIVLLMRRDDGSILEANTAAENSYGYSRDELLNLSINDLREMDTRGLTADLMRQADAGGILFETIHRRKDGSTFPVEVSSQGATIGGTRTLISVIRDITERKRAEERLSRAHRDLLEAKTEVDRIVEERTSELTRAYESLQIETEEREQAEAQLRQAHKLEAVGTLAGGIAHDFNNILAAMIGFSELARDDSPEGSPVRRHLERIIAGGIRGRELVKQILAFGRQTKQRKQPCKLAPVVRETLELLRASLPSTIDIWTSLQGESGFVLADPTQMQQVLMNLCTNAAYAMRRNGGRISIELTGFSFSSSDKAPDPTMSPGLYTKLSVRDTGEGISPEAIEHIFDPFFTTKAAGEGTGLGLSVVHGIVASHGGTITVSSGPEMGSTFTIYLPKFVEEQSRDSGDGGTSIPLGDERILLVDDEEDLVTMGDAMLTRLGYRVTSRTGAREALALLRLDPSRFDLVITDQTMPEMTGIDLAKEILTIRADMPIIMCTGFSHLIDADAAKAVGIKAFVMKPLTKREIARTIRKVLDE